MEIEYKNGLSGMNETMAVLATGIKELNEKSSMILYDIMSQSKNEVFCKACGQLTKTHIKVGCCMNCGAEKSYTDITQRTNPWLSRFQNLQAQRAFEITVKGKSDIEVGNGPKSMFINVEKVISDNLLPLIEREELQSNGFYGYEYDKEGDNYRLSTEPITSALPSHGIRVPKCYSKCIIKQPKIQNKGLTRKSNIIKRLLENEKVIIGDEINGIGETDEFENESEYLSISEED